VRNWRYWRFGKVPQEAKQELGGVLPGRFEDEVRRGEIKRRRRGYFGLFPSATKTGARPELAQGLKELTPSSHTSLKAPSLRHPATQDENRNRLNEETKINAWAPQLQSEENAERFIFTLSHDTERRARKPSSHINERLPRRFRRHQFIFPFLNELRLPRSESSPYNPSQKRRVESKRVSEEKWKDLGCRVLKHGNEHFQLRGEECGRHDLPLAPMDLAWNK